jgi:serine/threonine protein kinase
LGTNGREIVYIGKNVKKYVAIKEFRITDDDNRKNVKKELERRREEEPFKHPYLAEIIDVFEEDEYVYVVTELCLYGSLNKFYKLDIKLPEEV